jgi:8-oxo-dGTP pyrophosphatase MutT (NUDIX family)
MWDRLHLVESLPVGKIHHRAAVLAPLYEDDHGEVRVVLTKRPETMPTHAGHISFPGGRPHPGDGGPVGTAIREAQEEVGIDPEQVTVLGFLEPIDTVEYRLMVVPVVARISTPLNLIRSEREVERIYQPRLADLADPEHWAYVPWQSWKAWYYILDGATLWGATAHMVRQLVGLV